MNYIKGNNLKQTWELNADIRVISYDIFRKRIKKGMDTYEALTTKSKLGRKKKPVRQFWDENKHRAVVPLNTYKVRVNRDGMSFEEALTTEPKRTNNVDDEYVKWSNIAVKNGVNKAYFWQRVNEYNWSYERAATEKVKERKKDSDKDMIIEKDSDKDVKKMIINLLNAGEPVPKKYIKRFPELFEEAGR